MRTPVEEIAYRHGDVYGAQAALLPINDPLIVIDGGMHHGQSAEKYALAFPACRIFGFEPEEANFETSKARIKSFSERVQIFPFGLSDESGTAELKVNSHDGTHSLLEIGDISNWDEAATTVDRRAIQTVTLDSFCAAHSIDRVDVLKLDIQGGELRALTNKSVI